jgi:hypothetical protein
MREFRLLADDIDRHLEDAQLPPHAIWVFAACTTRLHGSPALLKLVLEELYPDDLFTKLVGDLDRVPLRRWPQGLTIAVALRQCSWRRDGLATIARRLHVVARKPALHAHLDRRTARPSRHRFSGSPRPCQGSPLRSDPIRGSRP